MRKKKVLIADDEYDVRLLVREILGENYTVLEARNGNEAINLIYKEQPNIILLDILMPKPDGYDVCRQIKSDKATRTIPVIMISGRHHELNKELGRKMGATGYVTKPFKPQDLLDELKKCGYVSATC